MKTLTNYAESTESFSNNLGSSLLLFL
jgi:hypothetical protein